MHRESLDWLYTSYALQWVAPPDQSPIIHRPKLEQALAYKPWAGNNIVISGPAGFGKSTLAILSALHHAETVWYLSVRAVPEIPGLKVTRSHIGSLTEQKGDETQSLNDEGKIPSETICSRHNSALVIDDIDLVPA